MTTLMDRFFVAIGFDAMELKQSQYRGWLYVGMVFSFGMASTFFIMALVG